jgi:hypothetical protein
LPLSFARAVRVTAWVPLELIVELLTNKSKLLAVTVVLVPVVLEPVPAVSSLLPPQAIREQSRVKEISSHNDRQ